MNDLLHTIYNFYYKINHYFCKKTTILSRKHGFRLRKPKFIFKLENLYIEFPRENDFYRETSKTDRETRLLSWDSRKLFLNLNLQSGREMRNPQKLPKTFDFPFLEVNRKLN
jgi:hypothetical protein